MNWFSLTLAVFLLQCAHVADSFIIDVIPNLLQKPKEWIQGIADWGSTVLDIPKYVLSGSASVWNTLVNKFEFTLPLEELGKSWVYDVGETDGVMRVLTMTNDSIAYFMDKLSSSEKYLDSLVQLPVRFWLYTRENKRNYEELYIGKLKTKYFVKRKPLMVITHGWTGDGETDSTQLIKDALLKKHNFNAIVVDWREIASKDYFMAASTVRFVGEKICDLLKDMSTSKKLKVRGKDVHLVGFSLGAHVMGAAGKCLRNANFHVSRITGLDPARPFFELPSLLQGLKKEDALFVDIIHTNAGILGLMFPRGHADFYPNGGVGQPGCYDQLAILPVDCDHRRAYQFFAESILHDVYEGTQCSSYIFYQLGICAGADSTSMGYGCEEDAEGNYYLQTDTPEIY